VAKAEQVLWRSLSVTQAIFEEENEQGTIYMPLVPVDTVDKVEYWDGEDWDELTADEHYFVLGGENAYIRISTSYSLVKVTFTTKAYENSDVVRTILDLVSVYYDHRPDEMEIEQKVVNRLAKYKVWVAR